VNNQAADELQGGDRMRRILLNGLLLALAAGCSQQPVKPNVSSAVKELDQAIASKATVPQPDAVSRALLPPIVLEMPKTDGKPVEPRFDLSVNNAAASEVFMAIVSGTRYSMIVHPSIKERVSVNLKDVTVKEALDTMREIYGYEYRIQGTRIIIEPVTMQTRVFRLNYLLSARKGRSEIRVSSGAVSDSTGSQQTPVASGTTPQPTSHAVESSKIVTTSDTDIWTDVASAVRTIIGAEGGRSVIVNAQSGIVVVRAMPAELRQVEDFLNAMQGVVARQVMLEAKIIEVQLKDQFATGINWAAFGEHIAAGILNPGTLLSPQGVISAFTARGDDGNLLPNSQIRSNTASPGFIQSETAVPGSVFGLALQTSSFAALLGFLETQGDLQVLSSPRIATLNNQKAVLKVGNDQFFVTNITNNQTINTAGQTQNAPSITLQPFFSGVALDVTPQIDEAEQIILHIHPSVSRVFNKTTDLDLGTAGAFRLPLASSDIRETDTIVRVGNGNIVAIGGLMTEASDKTNSGMPWLGDVPVLGVAFKNTNRRRLKSELVILLKPTVILNAESWKQDLEATRQRVQDLEYEPTPNILGVGPGAEKRSQPAAAPPAKAPATSPTAAPSGR